VYAHAGKNFQMRMQLFNDTQRQSFQAIG